MSEPFVWPTAERKLFAASATRTSFGLMLKAASRSGLSQMRMANVAPAQDVRLLHALQRGQTRLHDAHEIVRDLVRLQNVGRETQISRGELRIRRGDGERGHFRLGRQVVAHLVHLGTDLGQGFFGIVVQPQMDGDGDRPSLLADSM